MLVEPCLQRRSGFAGARGVSLFVDDRVSLCVVDDCVACLLCVLLCSADFVFLMYYEEKNAIFISPLESFILRSWVATRGVRLSC